MKNLLFVTTACLLMASSSFSQESLLAYTNPLSLNPAFTGYTGGSRITANYISLDAELPQPYRRANFSYDHFVNKINMGMGFNLTHQDERDLLHGRYISYNTVALLLSKKLVDKDRFKLLAGSEIYYYERESGQNIALLGRPSVRGFIYQPERVFEFKDVKGVDFQPSILFTTKRLIGGISVNNMLQPNISIIKGEQYYNYREYTYHLTYQFFNDRSKFRIAPDIIYRGNYLRKSVSLGTHFKYKWARAGLRLKHNLKNSDEGAVYAGYTRKNWSVNLARGTSISPINNGYRYIYQIGATYSFKRKEDKRQLKLPEIIAF